MEIVTKERKGVVKNRVLETSASQLAMLIWKCSRKIKELKKVVEEESKITRQDTSSTIAIILKRQEHLQAMAEKCFEFVEIGVTHPAASDKIRSLTVCVRNADMRRQAERSALGPSLDKMFDGPNGIDPIPPCRIVDEKEACSSLNRNMHRSKSAQDLPSAQSPSTSSFVNTLRSFLPQFTSSKFRNKKREKRAKGDARSPGSPPTSRSPSESSSVTSSVTSVITASNEEETQSVKSMRTQAAAIRLDKMMADASASPEKASFPSARTPDHRPPLPPTPLPPTWSEWGKLETMTKPMTPPSSQHTMHNGNNGEDGRISPTDLIPPLPLLSSERYFPFLTQAPAALAPVMNEITKSFDTEDVLKYTQKKFKNGVKPKVPLPTKELGQGEFENLNVSGLHTIMSSYSDDGESDQDYFNLRVSPSATFSELEHVRAKGPNNANEFGTQGSIPIASLTETEKYWIQKYDVDPKLVGPSATLCHRRNANSSAGNSFRQESNSNTSRALRQERSSYINFPGREKHGSTPSIPVTTSAESWDDQMDGSSWHDRMTTPPRHCIRPAVSLGAQDPVTRNILGRLENFRYRTCTTAGDWAKTWEELAKSLQDGDLTMLEEALAWDPELLRKEERQCLIFKRSMDKEKEMKLPPKLPPKQSTMPKYEGRLAGFMDDGEESSWEGIKPTLV